MEPAFQSRPSSTINTKTCEHDMPVQNTREVLTYQRHRYNSHLRLAPFSSTGCVFTPRKGSVSIIQQPLRKCMSLTSLTARWRRFRLRLRLRLRSRRNRRITRRHGTSLLLLHGDHLVLGTRAPAGTLDVAAERGKGRRHRGGAAQTGINGDSRRGHALQADAAAADGRGGGDCWAGRLVPGGRRRGGSRRRGRGGGGGSGGPWVYVSFVPSQRSVYARSPVGMVWCAQRGEDLPKDEEGGDEKLHGGQQSLDDGSDCTREDDLYPNDAVTEECVAMVKTD